MRHVLSLEGMEVEGRGERMQGSAAHLRLQVVFCQRHHLLVRHLGEEGCVLVEPQTLQPGGDV